MLRKLGLAALFAGFQLFWSSAAAFARGESDHGGSISGHALSGGGRSFAGSNFSGRAFQAVAALSVAVATMVAAATMAVGVIMAAATTVVGVAIGAPASISGTARRITIPTPTAPAAAITYDTYGYWHPTACYADPYAYGY